jgi:hypothetical protein
VRQRYIIVPLQIPSSYLLWCMRQDSCTLQVSEMVVHNNFASSSAAPNWHRYLTMKENLQIFYYIGSSAWRNRIIMYHCLRYWYR